MSDRELLELAAKAAGITINRWHTAYAPGEDRQLFALVDENDYWWNPLTGDGDALRLAVKLKMAVYPPEAKGDGATVRAPVDGPWITEEDDSDPYAAIRRAIVRAAAEIGKEKP